MKDFAKLVLPAVIALVCGIAQAQETGGVKISGTAQVTGVAKDVTTAAVGQGNRARTSVGSVSGNTEIQGNVHVTGVAQDVTTAAIGSGNAAGGGAGNVGGGR